MTSIDTWIDKHADSQRAAFRFDGNVTTYRQLAERIAIAAARLHRQGVGPGDRVAYCGFNRLETFDILFGCARLGAIVVPLNFRLVEAELAIQIADCNPRVLFAADGFASTLQAASGGRPVHDLDAEPFVAAEVDTEIPEHPVPPDAYVLMVYTSGTTGRPKGALLSHRALLATVRNGVHHQDLTEADRVLAPLPIFHVGGLNIQTLPALYVGAEVLLLPRFDPDSVLDIIEANRPTQGLLVPAMLAAVAASPRFASTDMSSLRGICTGSSVVPESLIMTYTRRGVPIGQVYGATETGPTSVVLGYGEAAGRPRSCGRAALLTEMRVVDAAGRDVPAGTDGEIWLRGPNMFSGYWNNPEATEAAFCDGWYRTGDIGHLDGDGYCYISDRLNDVVISGGENIYPAELEAVLSEHPSIVEVAVIARPDERWGEVPAAVAVLADGETLTIEELRGWCGGRLARYKHPRSLRLVQSLPRTALGKVQKHILRRDRGNE